MLRQKKKRKSNKVSINSYRPRLLRRNVHLWTTKRHKIYIKDRTLQSKRNQGDYFWRVILDGRRRRLSQTLYWNDEKVLEMNSNGRRRKVTELFYKGKHQKLWGKWILEKVKPRGLHEN